MFPVLQVHEVGIDPGGGVIGIYGGDVVVCTIRGLTLAVVDVLNRLKGLLQKPPLMASELPSEV